MIKSMALVDLLGAKVDSAMMANGKMINNTAKEHFILIMDQSIKVLGKKENNMVLDCLRKTKRLLKAYGNLEKESTGLLAFLDTKATMSLSTLERII